MPSGVHSVLDDERINGRSDFFAGLGAGIDGSWATSVGTLVPSNSETENYNWLGTVPQLSVWEGEALLQELPNYSALLSNVEFISALGVNKNDIRRDKTGMIRTRMSGLGRRAATHWEKLLSDLVLASETASGTDISGKAYDGQAFFDTDHSYVGSKFTTNQSNDLSAGVWDVATATAPTAEEAAECVLDMVGNFYALKDDQGEPINGDAMNFLLMVGTVPLYTAFKQAVGLQSLASGQTNPVTGLTGSGISIDVRLNPRLSAKATQVYGFRTDGDIKPFILQDEVGLSVEEEDPGITSKEVIVAAKATRAAGFGLWQGAMLGTLS
jgi:phage major head subunit gpT-like protein